MACGYILESHEIWWNVICAHVCVRVRSCVEWCMLAFFAFLDLVLFPFIFFIWSVHCPNGLEFGTDNNRPIQRVTGCMWNYWEHAWFYNSFCHCLPELQRWGNSSVEGESGRERHVVRNDPGRHRVGTKDFWDCHPWWTQRASIGRSQGEINRGEAPPWLCWEGTLAHKVFSCLHSRLKIESGISLIWHFAFTFCDVKQILHHYLAVQLWQWTFSTSPHLWPTRTWTSTTRHFDACTCNDAFRWTWTFLSQIPLQKHCHFKQCGVDRQKNDQKTGGPENPRAKRQQADGII